jgi:L-serine dehydratase
MLGLEGEAPETVDTDAVPGRLQRIRESGRLRLLGRAEIRFVEKDHLILHRRRSLPYHPNGMRFTALSDDGRELRAAVYYSVGGGFVVDERAAGADRIKSDATPLPYPFTTGAELLRLCRTHGLTIGALMLENETAWREEAEIRARLLEIWQVMQDCVRRGCAREGVLPGGLKVRRRAADLYRQLSAEARAHDPLDVMDWVNLYALAVNEENAAGGRVVTAPTNGAAGIVPAVLHYYARFCKGADDEGVVRFLLAAAAIGILCKENASISGAEVGCQGEVGSACSMAAAGLCEVLGGTPERRWRTPPRSPWSTIWG